MDEVSKTYRATPPLLQTMIDNILPAIYSKASISKGLQPTSGRLVQHCTALVLIKCLQKFETVRQALSRARDALEEDAENGQWAKRQRELEGEMRKRVPEFQVIVALSQQKHTLTTTEPDTSNTLKQWALISEAALRLMWLYHQSLPPLVAEARFEAGKLLSAITTTNDDSSDSFDQDGAPRALSVLSQYHVLRLLKESESFAWPTKLGKYTICDLTVHMVA